MNKYSLRKMLGVTLVEILLVMVIITSIIMIASRYFQQRAETARIDRTALQMQYILNAGLAYYVANGAWPGDSGTWYNTAPMGSNPMNPSSPLQPTYLPAQVTSNPWGLEAYYWHYYDANSFSNIPANTFQVWVYMGGSAKQQSNANILAAKFPFSYVTKPSDPFPNYVVAYVNIPTQDLNNAMAVNFAGLYHHGACVPVPNCPTTVGGGNMTPQIFVVPVSVSGVNDSAAIGPNNIYPISSFTAYSTAMSAVGGNPPACQGAGATAVACSPVGSTPTSGRYWRVCMQVVTERGDVQETRDDDWGNRVTVSAFTRCAISAEPSGSGFNVYSH